MSIEDELRDSLRRRAASVQARPDLDDVVARTTTRDGHTRRFLTVALVVALIAGPLAGFAIGRARDDGRGNVVTGGGATSEALAGGADSALSSGQPGTQPLEKLFIRTTGDGVVIRAYRTVVDSTAGAGNVATGQCSGGDQPCTEVACPSQPSVVGELSTDAAVGLANGAATGVEGSTFGPSTAWGTFGTAEGAPARWVLVSAGPDVHTVRASFPGGSTDEMEPVDGVALLASNVDSAPGGPVTVEALDADGDVVDSLNLGEGAADGSSVAASGANGGDGSSATTTLAPSSGSTTTLPSEASTTTSAPATTTTSGAATTTTSNTATDSASSSASASASASTSVAGGSGDSVTSTSDCAGANDPAPDVQASPPATSNTLPAPGEQPVDARTARQQVEHAYLVTYDGSRSMKSREGDVEGGDASKIQGQIESGPYADSVTKASATVSDVVFTSPTEATVRYDIDVKGGSQFHDRIGKAVLVDGAWKVAGETLCRDLEELIGLQCPQS